MSDCYLVSVLGSGLTRARYNANDARSKPVKPKRLYVIDTYHNKGDE